MPSPDSILQTAQCDVHLRAHVQTVFIMCRFHCLLLQLMQSGSMATLLDLPNNLCRSYYLPPNPTPLFAAYDDSWGSSLLEECAPSEFPTHTAVPVCSEHVSGGGYRGGVSGRRPWLTSNLKSPQSFFLKKAYALTFHFKSCRDLGAGKLPMASDKGCLHPIPLPALAWLRTEWEALGV